MDVGGWLRELGLEQYADAFAENGVDADLLPELTNEDLKDLGLARLADRKTVLKAIAQLSENDAGRSRESSSTPVLSGERRQVTVLFADIAGYTKLSSTLDAEETHALLNRYFDRVDSIVESFGGSVDKHIGDNVMAVFGAPIAHDDDPFRAVRAAIEIHERIGHLQVQGDRSLQVHIGIASGQVVASGTGSETHQEYTVIGDSVNLASRLQDMADPGDTLISGAVRHAIAERVDCQSIGKIQVKGLEQAVPIWKVSSLRGAEEMAARATFVGRESELAQLAGIVEVCRTSGRGRAIVIRGEAGIGKTRLVDEFTRVARAAGFKVQKGLVLDFGVGEGRDAIRAVVQGLLGIAPGSDSATRQAAAEVALNTGLLVPEQRVFLNDLLDLTQSPEDHAIYDAMTNVMRNEGKRTAIAEFVRASSTKQPVAVIFEDIHWADPLILSHLARLAATVTEFTGLLIMTSRMERYPLDEAWRSTAGGCPIMTFDLGPLRQEDSLKLAGNFIDTDNQIAVDCVRRAEGNPLFLEQLLRDVEEGGDWDIPASIQSLVLARIDRLPQTDKQALQAASVLGQRFTVEALRHVIAVPSYDCQVLVERSLVRPEGDDYLFDHALVQEGVYESILKNRRNELHLEAAAFYDGHDLVLCAEHLDRADDPTAANAYLEAASAQATALHFDTALRLADRGLELANDSDTTCDLRRLRGDALRNVGATEDSINEFVVALKVADDRTRQCRVLIGMAESLRIADQQRRGLEVLEDAETAAVESGLITERARIHYLRGNAYFPLGRIDECRNEHEKALAFARQSRSVEGEALALGGLGDAYYLQGYMKTACEQFRSCAKLCKEHGLRRIEVANRHMIGWTRIHLMEFLEAEQDALESIEMATEVNHMRGQLLGAMLAGCIYSELGRLKESDDYLERALELSLSMNSSNFAAQNLTWLAQNSNARGRKEEATSYAERGMEIVRKVGMSFYGPSILAIKAAVTDDPAESDKALKEAEDILDTGCVAHNHIWFARTAIDHALATGAWDRAEHYATRLENYTREQPLAWTDFIIARGRALAAWGRGQKSEELALKINQLRERAIEHGLLPAVPQLDEAQASI